jgi:phage tail-like protein
VNDVREELLRSDSFHLEVDGLSTAGFARCSGLGERFEVLAYREGGLGSLRQFRGAARSGRFVLERGLVRDRALWEWFRRGDPRDGAVLLLDAGGRERTRWVFRRGWPCAWSGPELDAEAAEVALERVEIIHEGVEWLPG